MKIENKLKNIAAAIKAGIATQKSVLVALNNAGERPEIVDGVVVPEPEQWHADDGSTEIVVNACSGEEAAQQYVDSGDWGQHLQTIWIAIRVWREGVDADGAIVRVNEQVHRVSLVNEPPCVDGTEHEWTDAHDIVGGIAENPGVWGHGAGVLITTACTKCGCGKTIDTWAQDPSTGVQGLHSISYVPGQFLYAIQTRRAN